MVTADGRVKVLDFGLARMKSDGGRVVLHSGRERDVGGLTLIVQAGYLSGLLVHRAV